MSMDKAEVAAVLEEIATLLELKGENAFKTNAYNRGARAIAQLEGSLDDYVTNKKLGTIPGIGEALEQKITTLVTTGKLGYYEDLKATIPAGVVQFLRLPGLGPKKVKILYEQLGIDTLDKLKAACDENKIAGIKGFGKKTQENILTGLAFLADAGQRVRIDQAERLAAEIVAVLSKVPGTKRLEVCGSLRRRRETVADIDLLASSDQPAALMDAFVGLPQMQTVSGKGETKSSGTVVGYTGSNRRYLMNCDLRVVSETEFPFALAYFTGNKDHNIAMRQRAIARGLKLNEYELAGPDRSVAAKDEADIFAALGADYIPPEMRESTGELAAAEAHKLPKLIELGDIVGVFHCHSDWSDGAATMEEMALGAKALGYKYFGFADHSQSLTIANGLSPERVREQKKAIESLRKKVKGIELFHGIECDILADGALDYDDETLAVFDYVVASVHSFFNQTQEEMTARICKAIRHPRVTMLGHATGRLLLKRDGYKVDLEKVLTTAAETGTLIEINASPPRLDLDWIHAKRAKALGVKLVINPDAHAVDEIALTRYGIDVARRGWLEKGDVFNTRSAAAVKKFFAERNK
jgi:DNA polymerase (family X)